MDRWNGVLKIQLHPNSSTFYRVAASLGLSSPKNLAVPFGNAIFFTGDRVEGTGNPVIERLSDPQTIAEILVSKFGGSVNAFVVEASEFNGSFAVYKDFIPTVNEYGEPKSYDVTGFPASTSLVLLLSRFLAELSLKHMKQQCQHWLQMQLIRATPTAKNIILGKQKEAYLYEASPSPFSCKPKTALLGFSKGGTVLNQLITEFAFSEIQSTQIPSQLNKKEEDSFIPTSKEGLFESISEIHYVDVGLNVEGAYLTDKDAIDRISARIAQRESGIFRFLFHGTPRQWRDERRIWIRKEKDTLVRLLKKTAHTNMGKLHLCERLYFPRKSPDLQMHFEIIDVMDVS